MLLVPNYRYASVWAGRLSARRTTPWDGHGRQTFLGSFSRLNGKKPAAQREEIPGSTGRNPRLNRVVLACLLLAVYGGSFLVLARRPERVLIGYKG
jgi:hypothetical protein